MYNPKCDAEVPWPCCSAKVSPGKTPRGKEVRPGIRKTTARCQERHRVRRAGLCAKRGALHVAARERPRQMQRFLRRNFPPSKEPRLAKNIERGPRQSGPAQ